MKNKDIKLIVKTLLAGGMITTAELLLMGPIIGTMFALSTFGGVAFVIMWLIFMPEGTEGAPWQ